MEREHQPEIGNTYIRTGGRGATSKEVQESTKCFEQREIQQN